MARSMTREDIAYQLAFWHGQKFVDRVDGETRTVAMRRDGGEGAPWTTERYAQRHSHEYLSAADWVLSVLKQDEYVG